ncbi:MAG: hypothetical protein H6822_24520 [Planctomycetaceae bacterium]|nr:hypothetical protein [Planctomycetales bacterium]MCB9925366.1 hypothetical protein [Planctomycetaceae bacterium]
MIQITRSLARELKTIFRRAITDTGRGSVHIPILFHAGPEGLRIRIASSEVAAEYHDPKPRESDEAIVPFKSLGDWEGRADDPIQLEATGGNEVLATWNDNSVPQMVRYAMPEVPCPFPDIPASLTDNPPELAMSLHDTMQTAAPESTRYALQCVQLRGSGTIVATDGSQMLLETGFDFPWDEDLMIPRRTVFGSGELPHGSNVQVGKSDDWVCFRMGCWSFFFAISKEGRFPDVESCVRDIASAAASVQIDSHDAAFLVKSIKQLPGDDAYNSPVTVDANGSVFIRSKSEDAPNPVELLLSNSTRTGQPERINTNRMFLRRALDLGFREIHVFAPDQPLLCVDDRRKYLWAVLTPSEAIKPSDDAVRISSALDDAYTTTKTTQFPKETTVAKAEATTAKIDQPQHAPSSTEELIDAAEQLKASLRDTLGKTSELIVGLKRHRREAKIVRTTLDSLRQLQTVG